MATKLPKFATQKRADGFTSINQLKKIRIPAKKIIYQKAGKTISYKRKAKFYYQSRITTPEVKVGGKVPEVYWKPLLNKARFNYYKRTGNLPRGFRVGKITMYKATREKLIAQGIVPGQKEERPLITGKDYSSASTLDALKDNLVSQKNMTEAEAEIAARDLLAAYYVKTVEAREERRSVPKMTAFLEEYAEFEPSPLA